MDLTNENYHSQEMRKAYMGYTQFKDFCECEKKAMAMINGELDDRKSDALLFGGYVDAYFSKELDDFIKANPEMFNSKTGELKAAFKPIGSVIESIESDPFMMKYMDGMHQVIMTGEIEGVPVKIKMDVYHPHKCIVDQKVMKDMKDVWIEEPDGNGGVRNVKTDFIDAFKYQWEGAIYQEICYQNTGERLPFVLCVSTKEETPDKALIQIDQEYLDEGLAYIKSRIKRFDDIKKGIIQPVGCGKCPVCRHGKKLSGVISYKKSFREKDGDIEY